MTVCRLKFGNTSYSILTSKSEIAKIFFSSQTETNPKKEKNTEIKNKKGA